MNQLTKYTLRKAGWYFATLIVALFLNFYLPRLIPGNPISSLVAQMLGPGATAARAKDVHMTFMKEFGLDKPVIIQFFNYVRMLFQGDLGTSFAHYPKPVGEILGSALPWTLALQVPAFTVGWILGNLLGAIAAYRKGVFDHVIFPISLYINSIPQYAFGIVLVWAFGVTLGWFPVGGGYSMALASDFSWSFISSAAYHYVLPFMSIMLITVGGQAIGMREMSIYELNSDYVLYSRSLGISDTKIVRYVFKNASLPQITAFGTTLPMLITGAVVTEVVFSYPGIGSLLFESIRQSDYPLIQGCTLFIILAVLIANFLLDILYGYIDPRVKSAQAEEVE